MYISAVSLNYIFVIKSDTSDPLGTWSSYGNVEHNGQLIQGGHIFLCIASLRLTGIGYDAHAVNLPDGRRYLA